MKGRSDITSRIFNLGMERSEVVVRCWKGFIMLVNWVNISGLMGFSTDVGSALM